MKNLYSLFTILVIIVLTTGCVEDVNIPNASDQAIESASPCQGNQGNGKGWGQITCNLDGDRGTVNDEDIAYTAVTWIGDDNCVNDNASPVAITAQQRAGIKYNCENKRAASKYTEDLPMADTGVQIIFIEIAINDIVGDNAVSVDEFGLALLQRIDTTDVDDVNCVVPRQAAWRKELHGDVMQPYIDKVYEVCSNTIDPHAFGVGEYQEDGLRWSQADHDIFLETVQQVAASTVL